VRLLEFSFVNTRFECRHVEVGTRFGGEDDYEPLALQKWGLCLRAVRSEEVRCAFQLPPAQYARVALGADGQLSVGLPTTCPLAGTRHELRCNCLASCNMAAVREL